MQTTREVKPMKNGIKWKAVIRDVVIVWILLFLAILVVGMTKSPNGNNAIILVFPFAAVLGFTFSGCMTKIHRGKHLFYVALGVWLVMGLVFCLIPRIVNGWYMGTIEWFVSIILVLFLMGIGGVLAHISSGRGDVSETTFIKDKNIESNNKTPNVNSSSFAQKWDSYSEIHRLAVEYIATNNERALISILGQAAKLDIPISIDDLDSLHFILAQLYRFRKFKDGKNLCTRILEVAPRDYHATCFLLTIATLEKDRHKEILFSNALLDSDYSRVIKELQPTLKSSVPEIRHSIKDVAGVFFNLGNTFSDMNEYNKALRGCEIAFEIDPSFIEAQLNIGIMLYTLKRFSEAIKCSEKTIELIEAIYNSNPQDMKLNQYKDEYLSRLFLNMGKSYFRMNRMAECKRYLGKSIEYDKHDKETDVNQLLYVLEHDQEL
jgi:tetratricopeptide (TPR) repeat protein